MLPPLGYYLVLLPVVILVVLCLLLCFHVATQRLEISQGPSSRRNLHVALEDLLVLLLVSHPAAVHVSSGNSSGRQRMALLLSKTGHISKAPSWSWRVCRCRDFCLLGCSFPVVPLFVAPSLLLLAQSRLPHGLVSLLPMFLPVQLS